jgi:Na+/H+-dicarboxylate symporter
MGWKYVAGAYICAVVCMVIKFVKVSYHTQVGITKLWRSFKPAMVEAFATGSEGAASKKSKSAVATDFGVKHDFSDLWLPLSQAMLAPSTTVLLTLAAFQCAEMSGTPISFGFILILVILSVELSLACPGLTASLTIMFSSLGMSTDYVGFFSAYNVLIRNMQAGFAVTYRMLEHLEEAYVLDAVDGGALLEGVEN